MVIGSDPHPVSLTWNIFVVFSSLFSAFILYLVYTIVIRPYVKMGFYRKQGISCYFFPLIGRLRLIRDSFKKYGDTNHFAKVKSRTNPERISCSNLGTEVALSLHDTALIKEFYLNNDNYEKAPILFAIYKPLLGRGLITSEGNQWKKQRKILSNAFHFEFLKSILPGIQDTAHQNLLRLQRESLQKVNMKEELQRITGEVIGKMFFGEQLNDYKYQNKPLTLALADIIIEVAQVSLSPIRHLLGPYLVTKGILPRHKRLMHNVKAFRQICSDIIEERKRSYEKEGSQQDKKKDMLDLLLQNSGEEGRLSDIEIIDQFVTFFLAGMDTTGHLINMTIYFLHKYPEYKEQMLEEIKRIYHPTKETTIEELNKMEFTVAFIKETLRFMTPVPGLFPRKAIKDHQIKDISIKAGTVVSMSFFYNHYNAVFFEDPDTFDPKRWLNKEKLSDAYAFVPFSAGPRNCIGQHLALIEARIILAEFLTMYDFELQKGYQLKMGIKFLYDPVEDILLDLTPKKQE